MSREHGMKRVLQAASASPEQAQGDSHGPDVLTQGRVCAKLGISDDTWRRWRARGITPPRVELPGLPRWKASDVDEFQAGRRWRHVDLGRRRA